MEIVRSWIFGLFILFFILILGIITIPLLNNYKDSGTLFIPGLKEPVRVVRDEKGMPYIYAGNFDDAIFTQGFITAQDRLFNMEVTKLLANGRISEMVGQKGKKTDIRNRTIGFYRNAKKHTAIMGKESKKFLQNYVDGVNAYIKQRSESYPLEFTLIGIKPKPWTIEESLAILYYMGWGSSANLRDEIVAQFLVDRLGSNRAKELFPLNINPDELTTTSNNLSERNYKQSQLNLINDSMVVSYLKEGCLSIGSNNWATGPDMSSRGKPIIANDPHLEINLLPSPWYSIGIITPEFRAVGAMIPGLPGMVIGRTDKFAIGITNAYGDTQDLYIETVDPTNPNNYLEGTTSIPFEIIEETLIVKDKSAPDGIKKEKFKIRFTKRGPIISEVNSDLPRDKVVTMRWSIAETMSANLAFNTLLTSRNISDVRSSLSEITTIMLNFVFADVEGNIGWQTTGRLPIRSQGESLVPFVVKNDKDNWTGWIPFDEMPQSYNPIKGWVGTCNQKTITGDFPYYYSTHFSPSYRYRRLKDLMLKPGKRIASDYWEYQRDTKNLMAELLTPIMIESLSKHEKTKVLAQILKNWNYHDDPDIPGPTVFHSVYMQFAKLVFQDELGEDGAMLMLSNWYFWQERLAKMVLNRQSPWFDDINTTERKEDYDDIFYRAALITLDKLKSEIDENPEKWYWGEIHKIEFLSLIRREGVGKDLLGHGPIAAPGSGEVLYRGKYRFNEPFKVKIAASLRMVADLADFEKIMAVLPGGETGRLFHPHFKDQVSPYMNGDHIYWWFSDLMIEKNKTAELQLLPQK